MLAREKHNRMAEMLKYTYVLMTQEQMIITKQYIRIQNQQHEI